MKTKKINIYDAQRRWLHWHTAAGATIERDGRSGQVLRAVYPAPMQQWRGLIGADGCVEVPDMEHYNGITDADEIRAMVDEIFDGPMEGR